MHDISSVGTLVIIGIYSSDIGHKFEFLNFQFAIQPRIKIAKRAEYGARTYGSSEFNEVGACIDIVHVSYTQTKRF